MESDRNRPTSAEIIAALGLLSMADEAQTAPGTAITAGEILNPESEITAEAKDLNAAEIEDVSEIMGSLVNELDPNPDPRNSIFRVHHARSFTDFYTMARPSSKKRKDNVLGSGSYGEVRLCKDKMVGNLWACKVICKAKLQESPRLQERVRNEAKIHRRLSGHPNVVHLMDVFEDESCVYMVMEYCKLGSLHGFMRANHPEGLDPELAAEIMDSIAQFLKFSHAQGFVHRDLKPENILMVSKNGPIKMADFGNAFQINPDGSGASSFRRRMSGTHGYMAPEVVREEQYGSGIDVWSAGILLVEILTGKLPFVPIAPSTKNPNFMKAGGIRHDAAIAREMWAKVPSQAKHLIDQMLNPDPNHRISAAQICDHPWIRNREPVLVDMECKPRRRNVWRKICKTGSLIVPCIGTKYEFKKLATKGTQVDSKWHAGNSAGLA